MVRCGECGEWCTYLVLEHGEQQRVGDDRVVAVDEVEPVLLGQVAHDVERPVEVLQRDHLAAHRVVEPPRDVGVQQAVAHPDARADLLGDLVHELEGALVRVRFRVRVRVGVRVRVRVRVGVRVSSDTS